MLLSTQVFLKSKKTSWHNPKSKEHGINNLIDA